MKVTPDDSRRTIDTAGPVPSTINNQLSTNRRPQILSRRRFLTGGAAGLSALVLPGSGCRPSRSGASPAAPPPAAGPARFTDVTEAAGLSFIQSSGGCGLYYFVE